MQIHDFFMLFNQVEFELILFNRMYKKMQINFVKLQLLVNYQHK
jgi:hypothetical protein